MKLIDLKKFKRKQMLKKLKNNPFILNYIVSLIATIVVTLLIVLHKFGVITLQ